MAELDHTFLTTIRVRRARRRVVTQLPLRAGSKTALATGQLLEITCHGHTVGVYDTLREAVLWKHEGIAGLKESELVKFTQLALQMMDAAQVGGLTDQPEAMAA